MTENDIAGLLDQHLPGDYTHLFYADPGSVDPPVGCRCGWRRERGVSHHLHVARVLLAPHVPDTTFIGSSALLSALYDTYVEHIGITEPDRPYVRCGCGWRSDDLGPNDNPGNSYAVHLTNAQHAAAVKALQPLVTRVIPPGEPCTDCASPAEVTDCRADTGDRCGPCHVASCAECQDALADQDAAEAANDGRWS